MHLKTVIKWTHTLVTLILAVVVAGLLYLNSGGDSRENDKLISSSQIDKNTWLYITEYGSGGATVPYLYRYYLAGKLEGNVSGQLARSVAFMEAGGSAAQVSAEGDTITISYGGKVYAFSNSVVYESHGETLQPHINFHARN